MKARKLAWPGYLLLMNEKLALDCPACLIAEYQAEKRAPRPEQGVMLKWASLAGHLY